MSYTLSAVVDGHSNDVRCVTAFKSSNSNEYGLISGSRDATARLWTPQIEDGSADGLRQWNLKTLFKGHPTYVSCISYRPADDNFKHGAVYTGCHDGRIRVYEPHIPDPVSVLEGHTATVSNLFISATKTVLSSSWDMTGRVWLNEKTVMTLKGHEAAVWCGVIMPTMGIMVTGSADTTIKFWKAGVCKRTVKKHTQAVRDLGILGSNQLVSCSNDGQIVVWSIAEADMAVEVAFQFEDSDFVYSLSVLPSLQGQGWVSSGENTGLKVFKDGRVQQEIAVPAISVWSVTILDNGDIACGCSDNKIYIFTTEKGRIAPPDLLTLFDAEVKRFKEPKQEASNGTGLPDEIGGVKTTDIPGPDALNYPGKREGQTKMIRHGNTVSVHSWSASDQEWTKVGDVVGEPDKSGDTPKPGGKTVFEGKEYDHVFHIDIDEGVVLKLPYNNDEEPYVAAQQFIHKHNLPQDYLDQVATFIAKNSSGKPRQSVGTAADPLTGGGAYVSGSGGVQASGFGGGVADPFTGGGAYSTTPMDTSEPPENTYFPQKEFLQFANVPNLDALTKKLLEFNAQMPASASLEEEQIKRVVSLNSVETPSAVDVPQLLKVLKWPKTIDVNPALDMTRLVVLKPPFSDAIFGNASISAEFADVIISHIADASKPKNQMLALKVLVNLFNSSRGEGLMVQFAEVILQHISALLPTDNKVTQVSIATLVLNYAVSASKSSNSERQKQCLTLISVLLDCLTDTEAKFRTLVALGTLLDASPDNDAVAKSLDIKERVKTCNLVGEAKKVVVVSQVILMHMV